MNVNEKIKHILEVAGSCKQSMFTFAHDELQYVIDLTGNNIELYLAADHKNLKKKSRKQAKDIKAKAEKVLWIDSNNNKIGYGEEARLKAIELVSQN